MKSVKAECGIYRACVRLTRHPFFLPHFDIETSRMNVTVLPYTAYSESYSEKILQLTSSTNL